MSILELSVLTAVFIVIAFTMGFLFGIGYQSGEDRRHIKNVHKTCEDNMKELREMSTNFYRQGYEQGRRHEKEEAALRAELEWQELLNSIGQEDNIKFGGF